MHTSVQEDLWFHKKNTWYLGINWLKWNPLTRRYKITLNKFAIYNVVTALILSILGYLFTENVFYHIQWSNFLILWAWLYAVGYYFSNKELVLLNMMERSDATMSVLKLSTRVWHAWIFDKLYFWFYKYGFFILVTLLVYVLVIGDDKHLLMPIYFCFLSFHEIVQIMKYMKMVNYRMESVVENLKNYNMDNSTNRCLVCLKLIHLVNYRSQKDICMLHYIR